MGVGDGGGGGSGADGRCFSGGTRPRPGRRRIVGGAEAEEAKVQAQLVVPHAAVRPVGGAAKTRAGARGERRRSHPHRASARAEASDQAGSATAAPVSSGSKGDPGPDAQVVPEAGQVASVAAAPDAEAAATAHRRSSPISPAGGSSRRK